MQNVPMVPNLEQPEVEIAQGRPEMTPLCSDRKATVKLGLFVKQPFFRPIRLIRRIIQNHKLSRSTVDSVVSWLKYFASDQDLLGSNPTFAKICLLCSIRLIR